MTAPASARGPSRVAGGPRTASPMRRTGRTVFDAAIERLVALYENGDRVVVSLSGGKDSGVCLELAAIAARLTGSLPVEVVMRDEEIMFPGTYEYLERVANRPDVSFTWLVSRHAISNIYNRADPWWWTFDPRLPSSQWVREPPRSAVECDEPSIFRMTIPERYPVESGQRLIAVTGLRARESFQRYYSVYSAGGHLTLPNKSGVRTSRPIYDWHEGDVWRAYREYGWTYNGAYDVLLRMGATPTEARISPPTLNRLGIKILGYGALAWPQWFDRVCSRLPGVRTAAMFGARAVTPRRRLGESWRDVFFRECIDEAPEFVRDRSSRAHRRLASSHRKHAGTDLPDTASCRNCSGSIGSYRAMTLALYNGDPLNSRVGNVLPNLEEQLVPPWWTEAPDLAHRTITPIPSPRRNDG